MMQKAVEKALSLVGQGYIYGAKGQKCSAAFRKQQAQQYPDQARMILENGTRWDGMPVWDCAQLTRACAAAAGFELVSGATSQWQKTSWAQKGDISTLPADTAAFVFRQSDGRMQHTGLSLGDGTCVHAKGTLYGVVREEISVPGWTHWAALTAPVLHQAIVTAPEGSTVNLRTAPGASVCARIPVGTQADVMKEQDGWSFLTACGMTGWMQSRFVKPNEPTLLERVEKIEARLTAAGL